MALTLIENESVIVVNTVVENTTIEVIEEPKQVVVTESDNIVTLETLAGAQGEIGPQGPQGIQGIQGEAATVDVGTTETVAPDQPAEVTNAGTVNDAILNFKVPQGIQGEVGESGYLVETAGTYPERPPGDGAVTFVGETNPDLLGIMLVGDTWINTATDGSGAPSYLQADTTAPILATNIVENPRFVKTSGDVLVQESLLGYGGSTPAKNAASAPLIDLDYLGTDGFVKMNGTDGSAIRAATSPDFDFATTLEARVKLSVTDPTKWHAVGIIERAATWRIMGTKVGSEFRLVFQYIDATTGSWFGINSPTDISTYVNSSEPFWVRFVFSKPSKSVGFYVSLDGENWTSAGTSVYSSDPNVVVLQNAINVGARDGMYGVLSGRVYAAKVYTDDDAVLDLDVDTFTDKAVAPATTVDSVGRTWQLLGSGVKAHTRKVAWLPGTAGNYISTPDKNELDYDSSTFENGVGKWEGLNKNLLSADYSSFETLPLVTGQNSTCQRVTDSAYTGTASLSVTATGGGLFGVWFDAAKVVPGQVYTASAMVRLRSGNPRKLKVGIEWLDDVPATVIRSVTSSAYSAYHSAGWVQIVAVGQAPSDAGAARLTFYAEDGAGGDSFGLDAVSLMETPNANLIPNPDFEDGITGWQADVGAPTLSRSSEQAYTGTSSLKLTNSTSATDCAVSSPVFPVIGGQTYTVSAYVRTSYAADVRWDTSTSIGTAVPVAANTWTRVTHTFTAASTTSYRAYLHSLGIVNSASNVYVDAVQIVKGSTAVPYLPPKTTNLLSNPSGEAGTGWLSNDTNYYTASWDSTVSFSGTRSRKVVRTGGTTRSSVLSVYAVGAPNKVEVVAGKTYTFSAFARAGQSGYETYATLSFYTQDNTHISSTSGAVIASPTGAWVRPFVVATVPANAANAFTDITVRKVDGTPAPDGDYAHIDAAQLEYGSVPTPFVDGSLGAGYSWDSSENLVSAATSSFEDGTTGGWAAGANNTLANDATQAFSGTKSLSLTATAAGQVAPWMPIRPVVGGQIYTFSFYTKAATTARSVTIQLSWRDSGGAVISNSSETGNNSTTGWTRHIVTAVAPSNAVNVFGYIYVNSMLAGEKHYLDAVQLEQRPFATPYGQTGVAHASTSTRQMPWVLGGTSFENLITTTGFNFDGTKSLYAQMQITWAPLSLATYNKGVRYKATVSPSTNYTFSAYLIPANSATKVQVVDVKTQAVLGEATRFGGGYPTPIRVSAPFTTTSTTTEVYLQLVDEYGNIGPGGHYLRADSIQLEKSTTATAYVPPLRITGDIDIRAKVALEDWTPTPAGSWTDVVSRHSADPAYNLRFSDEKLAFTWMDGNDGLLKTLSATENIAFSDRAPGWIRATLDCDNGAGQAEVKFYTSLNGIAWTQLGSTRTNPVTKISAGSTPLQISGRDTSNGMVKGNVLSAQVRAGIDGQVVAEFNAQEGDNSAGTWTDSSNRVWTINRSGDSTAEMVDRNTWTFSGNQYLQFPDRSELDFAAATELTVMVAASTRNTSVGLIVDKGAYSNNLPNYMLGHLDSRKLFARTANTGVDSYIESPIANAIPAGVTSTFGFSRATNGDQSTYIAGAWVETEPGVNGTLENNSPLYFGAAKPDIADNFEGLSSWLAIFRRLLTTAEHAELGAWNGRIATEPVWLREAATLYVNADDALTRQLYRDYNYVYNLADGFTGDTAAAGDYTYQWTGTAYQSTAKKIAPRLSWFSVGGATSKLWQGVDGVDKVGRFVTDGGPNNNGNNRLYLATLTSGNYYTVIIRAKASSAGVYSLGADLTGEPLGDGDFTVGQDWTTINRKFSITSNAPLFLMPKNNVAASAMLTIGSVLVIAADYRGSYFDGETPGAQWTGTAHASTSQKILVSRSDLFDYKLPARTNNALLLPDSLQSSGWKFSNTLYLEGTGFPEGVVTAPVGSRYIDTAATNGAVEWVKTSGTGNTGWKVAVGDTGWRNVAGDLLNGWTASAVYFRRVGEQASFRLESLNGSQKTSDSFLNHIVGFRPYPHNKGQVWKVGESGDIAQWTGIRHDQGGYIKWVHGPLTGIWGTIPNFFTNDAWPTILPGIPA